MSKAKLAIALAHSKPYRPHRIHLARECAKMDPAEETAMAEEGMSTELGGWPALAGALAKRPPRKLRGSSRSERE